MKLNYLTEMVLYIMYKVPVDVQYTKFKDAEEE